MYPSILEFWFQEIAPAQWWKIDPAFDNLVAERFGAIHAQAARSELFAWRATPQGRLAEIIVLDQFSRNIHRGTRRAFEADTLALALAQEQRNFLYMPLMHSESKKIHAVAEPLFKVNTPDSIYNFELRHKAIIDRFGRYPHRNVMMGRTSTPEELAFLTEPGSSF